MAVVYVREIYRGVGLKVQYTGREMEGSVVRKFLIRVDDLATSGGAICSAPGVTVGSEHPALKKWYAVDFSVDCEDGAGLMWALTVTYKSNTRKVDDKGVPEDEWSLACDAALYPCVDYLPDPAAPGTLKRIENSAGSPIEGLKKDVGEYSWKLVRSFETAVELMTVANAVNNTTNGATWSARPAESWKCQFKSGTRKKLEKPKRTSPGDTANENAGADGEIEEKEYWEGVFEFRMKKDGWHWKPWDAGFMQKVDDDGKPSESGTSLAAIKGKDGKPVKEVWKLNGKGIAIMEPSTPPVALDFAIYETKDFYAIFGEPPA